MVKHIGAILLFLLVSLTFIECLDQCSKTNLVNIRLRGALLGGYTRFWQLSTEVDVGTSVCHEIEKKLKYATTCAYGSKSKKCNCAGSWSNEQGVNSRIAAANKVLPSGQLVECSS
ncbi:hypothetical protein K7432_005913 [Basidiobolus ranarum]|uniref:Uncharacterized protein n=1 Tax=Basidiobolus ranarum TaxID=34480 RepID=A0ABR2WVR0_9FUNG